MDSYTKLKDINAVYSAELLEYIGKYQSYEASSLLIEAIRAIDYWHFQSKLRTTSAVRLPHDELFFISKGWNKLCEELLPKTKGVQGFPISTSTSKSISKVTALLYALGKVEVLSENLDMVTCGVAEVKVGKGNNYSFSMSNSFQHDHFSDLSDKQDYLKEFSGGLNEDFLSGFRLKGIEKRLEAITRPFETDYGIMVGYDAEPDIDEHYLSLALEMMPHLQFEVGIHPESSIDGVSGSDIIAVGSFSITARLKHMGHVSVGSRKIENMNIFMGLPIWESKQNYAESLADHTGLSIDRVLKALDLFILTPDRAALLKHEARPFIPCFIQISDDYLLMPMSSVFGNILSGVRSLHSHNGKNMATLIEPREGWMINDLYHLFQGNRYKVLSRPAKLKKNKAFITDIDAAIYDTLSGTLALFQLKWQDFGLNIKSHSSKAKNFMEATQTWSTVTSAWIEEFGVKELFHRLNIKLDRPPEDICIKQFAIGRSRVRFNSFGHKLEPNLAYASWPQFTNMRLSIGSAEDTLGQLHESLMNPKSQPVQHMPLPVAFEIKDTKIILENYFYGYPGDDKTVEQGAT